MKDKNKEFSKLILGTKSDLTNKELPAPDKVLADMSKKYKKKSK